MTKAEAGRLGGLKTITLHPKSRERMKELSLLGVIARGIEPLELMQERIKKEELLSKEEVRPIKTRAPYFK